MESTKTLVDVAWAGPPDRDEAGSPNVVGAVALAAAIRALRGIGMEAIARRAHASGAEILVDCAQLAPHRRVSLGDIDDPAHLDYVAISAHKMYAPFGTGALIGRRETFEQGVREYRGGGTIEIVTTEQVEWAGAPDRDEAGSPNVGGAVALAAAIKALDQIGMAVIAEHEAELTAYALEQLKPIEQLEIYGETEVAAVHQRLGLIPLNGGYAFPKDRFKKRKPVD